MIDKKAKKILESFAVLWIIVSSGSLYFMVLNMTTCMIILALIAFMYLIMYFRISSTNLKVFFFILCLLTLDYIFNIENGFSAKDAAILLIRLSSLMIIQSCITADNFKRLYIKIMVIYAVVSLVCFFYVTILSHNTLPFLKISSNNINGFIYTFYYTLGWTNIGIFNRNAGFFWEPGGYQIFINVALLFLISDQNISFGKKEKWNIFSLVILVITIISTLSTTGYICFALVILYALLIKRKRSLNIKLKILVLLSIVALFIAENYLGVISNKIGNIHSSYSTRSNDTIEGYKVVLNSPVWGFGFFNTIQSSMLAQYGIINNSNGFAGLVISIGIPLSLLYLYTFYKRTKVLLQAKGFLALIAMCIFLLFFNSEDVISFTFFLSFLFKWRTNDITSASTLE
jgi:hypothetical protein